MAVEEKADADAGFVDLRQLWGQVEERVWAIAGRAVQIVAWDRAHQFCGRCGEPTEPMAGERAGGARNAPSSCTHVWPRR